MKKSDLFKIIKDIIKEQRASTRRVDKGGQNKNVTRADQEKLRSLRDQVRRLRDAGEEIPRDMVTLMRDIERGRFSNVLTKQDIVDPGGNFVAAGMVSYNSCEGDSSGNFEDYGTLTLFAGDCGVQGLLTEDLNDGFICCSSNNNVNNDGNHAFVDTTWGPYDLLDGFNIDEVSCYCPYPNSQNGELIDCWSGPGSSLTSANQLMTISHVNTWLTSIGEDTIDQYTDYEGADGTTSHTGELCAGCFYDPANASAGVTINNHLQRVSGGSYASDPDEILGCPDGSGNYLTGLSRDNVGCCNFTLECASGNLTAYDDGAALSNAINVNPNNPTSVVTQGPAGNTIAWDDAMMASQTNGAVNDSGGCRFDGCDQDNGVGGVGIGNSTNYLTVVYNSQNVSGPNYVDDDGSCIATALGCTDDGSDPNGNSPFPGQQACNYDPSANTDDGSCDYDICRGCLDGGANAGAAGYAPDAGASNERPAGFVGDACNYDANNTISDPDVCEYTSCVGCMDDGTDPTLAGSGRTTGTYAALWANSTAAACNYDATMTNSDPAACTYDDCVGCMNIDACNNNPVPQGLTVGDPSQCDWSCYGCTQEGMDNYNASFTNNNTVSNGIPADPPSTPCVYNGCLYPDENSPTPGVSGGGLPHSNYVCNVNWQLCTVGGSACSGPCPLGVYDVNLGQFSDAGNCNVQVIEGCHSDPNDCNYDPTATGGDQTVGAISSQTGLPMCTGQPATCVSCVQDPNNPTVMVPGDPNDPADADPLCGCTDSTACNYDDNASTDPALNPIYQSSCVIPNGMCEVCDPGGGASVIPNPQCIGCLQPYACNFGYDTDGNYDPNGPIATCFDANGPTNAAGCPTGTQPTFTDDGSCVMPGGSQGAQVVTTIPGGGSYSLGSQCDICDVNNIPNLIYNPSCDGCANPDACNYDSGAQNVNDPSCIIPDDCNICDPNDPNGVGPLYTSPLIPNPACACRDVIAYECNNETNIRNISCMTIDGNLPNPNDPFELQVKIKFALEEGKTPVLETVSPKDNLLTEQERKFQNVGSTNQPRGGSPLKIAKPIDDMMYDPSKKVFIVDSVVDTYGNVRDYPSATCVDRNFKCYCFHTQNNANGPGWAGHPHGCIATDDPVGGNVYATKAECKAVCDGEQDALNPTSDCVDGGYDQDNTGWGSSDVCAEGCKNPNAINAGRCCVPAQDGLPVMNHNPACCINIGIGTGTGTGTGTCFIPKTPITMEDGTTKRIDEIKVGDIVKSEEGTSTVEKIRIHEGKFDVYSLNGSEFFVTAEHPFKTEKGWKAIDPHETWVHHGIESNVLEIGDVLLKNGNKETLETISKSDVQVDKVYSLILDNEHVYYVYDYLVHNAEDMGKDTGKNIFDIPNPDDPDFFGESEVKDSKNLRKLFEKEFKTKSKEQKLKEAIRRIIKKRHK